MRHPDRAAPQPQHTHATTGTPSCCHYSLHNARAWRLACTCVPSVIDVCAAASKRSGCGVRPTGGLFPLRARRRAPGRDVCISPVRCVCPAAYFSMTEKHLRPLFLPLPFLQCFLLLPPTVSQSVCFSFPWFSGSQPGFVQHLALSEEHRSTKRGSRQEHLSANSRLKASRNSSETRTDRHFLASEVGETLASNLQRMIDTTETILRCWNDWLLV